MSNLVEQMTSGQELRLTIQAADELAEVMIIDGELNVAARSIGILSAELPAGVYKIKQKLGERESERLILLRNNGQFETFEPLDTGSALPPLRHYPDDRTGTTRNSSNNGGQGAYNIETWTELCLSSRAPLVLTYGEGAEIAIFLRLGSVDPTLVGMDTPTLPYSFDLLDDTGESAIDGPMAITADALIDGCYSVTVVVSPGAHYLTLYTPHKTSMPRMSTQQTLFASPGWQTRIYGFLQAGPTSEYSSLQIDSERISINMAAIGSGPSPTDMRLIETARQALLAGQNVDLAERNHMLVEKFNDPILGLFAAHLILGSRKKSAQSSGAFPDVLHTIVGNLKMMVSPGSQTGEYYPHPDVVALHNYINTETDIQAVTQPPMLLNSWQILVEKSLDSDDDLIETDSDVERISTFVINSRPWMRWEAPRATTNFWRAVRSVRRGLEGLFGYERLDVVSESYWQEMAGHNAGLVFENIADEILISMADKKDDIAKRLTSTTSEKIEAARIKLSQLPEINRALQRDIGNRLGLPPNKVKQMLREFGSASFNK